jgi:hypothetical protein
VTINPITGTVWQHVEFDKACYALRHPRGTPETNRQGALQIEIIDRDGDASEWNKSIHLADMLQWFVNHFPIRRTPHPVFSTSRCYGANSPCRMLEDEWELFDGICGHQHVPNNTHWDPGPLDVSGLLALGGDNMGLAEHEQQHERANNLQIAARNWANDIWNQYVAAGGSTVPESRTWRTSREDLAWIYTKFIAPLEAEVAENSTRIRNLESRVVALENASPPSSPGIQFGDIVRLEKTT